MNIYYIYHSCFIVETNSSFLIFDYYKNKNDPNSDFDFKKLINDIFQSKKSLYIFVSHNHQDHYNSKILTWRRNKSNTYFVFSDDIKLFNQIDNLHMVKQNEELTIENLVVKTFGSTDKGVSFLVAIDNLTVFHAGDLNWWKWMDDTKDEEETMEKSFKSIINLIAQKTSEIDIAFFPVDRRLKVNYLCGGEYFIKKLKPKIFIPMHFWENYETTSDFKKSLKNLTYTKIIELNHSNSII